jgi:hypothetical protein
MAIFTGGLVQLLAGMWEFPRGNVFGATGERSFLLSHWLRGALVLDGVCHLGLCFDTITHLTNLHAPPFCPISDSRGDLWGVASSVQPHNLNCGVSSTRSGMLELFSRAIGDIFVTSFPFLEGIVDRSLYHCSIYLVIIAIAHANQSLGITQHSRLTELSGCPMPRS